MKNGNLVAIILFIFFFAACRQESQNNSGPNTSGADTGGYNRDETESINDNPINSSPLIGEATVWRVAKEEGSANWEKVVVTNVFGLSEQIPVDSEVLVMPLAGGLQPIILKVIAMRPRTEDGKTTYEVDLSDVSDKSWWEYRAPADRRAEFPFDVIVMYPVVRGARITEAPADLPQDVTAAIVTAAVDINSDGNVDALICDFCCSDRTKPECDYICSETWALEDGKWIKKRETQPM